MLGNFSAVKIRQAAAALHNSGVPLRDIGALLNISYQRAHQLVSEAAEQNSLAEGEAFFETATIARAGAPAKRVPSAAAKTGAVPTATGAPRAPAKTTAVRGEVGGEGRTSGTLGHGPQSPREDSPAETAAKPKAAKPRRGHAGERRPNA